MDVRHRERAQVVHPAVAGERLVIGRLAPPDDLAWCVDYCWWVRWDTPEPYEQKVVPRPVVHVAAEWWDGDARLVVAGIPTEHFIRRLEGRGRTVALAFRPGGFRPFLSHPVSELVDASGPVEQLMGAPDDGVGGRLLDLDVDVDDGGRALFAWLRTHAPAPDPVVDDLASLVELAERDASIRRAEQLADAAGVSLRTLQRRFREYIGPGPKWVVQRYRLLDVVAVANAGDHVDWSALAAELGYTDQSHLIRHFRAVVGEPPARYAEQRGAG